jgi:tetratricopeptide (TPR) repeat protein
MRLILAIGVVLWGAIAAADARQDQAARDAYKIGRAAYEAGDYQIAYDKFKESFQLSHEPALLYNISSALQGLKRPHEAAEALRSFIRLSPNDPDRENIDKRIATLEEEQKMIDAERQKNAPPPVTPPPPEVRTVIIQQPAFVQPGPTEAERKRRNKILAITLTVGGVVLVGGAVTLAVLLSQSKTDAYTVTSLGPHPGTR